MKTPEDVMKSTVGENIHLVRYDELKKIYLYYAKCDCCQETDFYVSHGYQSYFYKYKHLECDTCGMYIGSFLDVDFRYTTVPIYIANQLTL
jgi:hypothetical protein